MVTGSNTKKKADDDPVWIVVGDSVDIGVIDGATAVALKCVAGPIRLPEGFGGSKGYGLRHIEDNDQRVKQIKGVGFKSVKDYVVTIAANWTVVEAANEADRWVLIYEHGGYGHRLIVQISKTPTGHCWSVVTAIPGRKVNPKNVIYKK